MQQTTEWKSLRKANGGSDGKLIVITTPGSKAYNPKADGLEKVTAKDGSEYFRLHLTNSTNGTIVAEGSYEGVDVSKFGKNNLTSYKIRAGNGDLIKFNGSFALDQQFKELEGLEGTMVQVCFHGVKTTKNGNTVNDFEVLMK